MSESPDETWPADRLRELAAEMGVDLSSASTKAAMLTLIQAEPLNVADATERSIADAVRRGVLSEALQAGPIQALRALARKIDMVDLYMAALAEDAEARGLRPPSQDNVSLSAYLKYTQALGLLPGKAVGEARAPGAKPQTPKTEEPPPAAEEPAAADPTPMPQGQDRAARLSKLRGRHAG